MAINDVREKVGSVSEIAIDSDAKMRGKLTIQETKTERITFTHEFKITHNLTYYRSLLLRHYIEHL